MPTNCSKDINRVVNFLDLIHKSHNPWMQQEIKEMFGLEDLEYFDDVGEWVVLSLIDCACVNRVVRSNMARGSGSRIPSPRDTPSSSSSVTQSRYVGGLLLTHLPDQTERPTRR